MMNFANITSADKTSTINLLDFKKYPKIRELHENNIKKVINKIPASLKTKALSLLLDKGKSIRSIASMVDIAESTIRSWIIKKLLRR